MKERLQITERKVAFLEMCVCVEKYFVNVHFCGTGATAGHLLGFLKFPNNFSTFVMASFGFIFVSVCVIICTSEDSSQHRLRFNPALISVSTSLKVQNIPY